MVESNLAGNVFWNKLTNKQKAFVACYLITFDSKAAAKAAGYTSNQRKIGNNVLKRKNVAACIEAEQKRVTTDAIMGYDEAREILTKIIRANPSDFVNDRGEIDLANGDPVALGEFILDEDVQTGKVVRHKIKVWDKVRSIERLARLSGWDRVHESEQTMHYTIKLPENFPTTEED